MQSAIDQINLDRLQAEAKGDRGKLRDGFRYMLWDWIESHPDERIHLRFKLFKWTLGRDFKVSELHDVFTLILGPRPYFIP